jgi:hypothetical protein
LLVAAGLALASCGGEEEPSGANGAGTSTPSASSSAEPDGSKSADLSKLDRCSLITVAKVQELTGSKARFLAQRGYERCFWAAAVPGVGGYVEITVSPAGGLGPSSPVAGCPGSPMTGVGEEARGGTCPGTQLKVYVMAYASGVYASVLVNDPQRPLTPADLAATANEVFANL